MRGITAAMLARATSQTMAFPAAVQAECDATETMRGGANNYRPNAPLVENLGVGWRVSGVVREAGSCPPLTGVSGALSLAISGTVSSGMPLHPYG